MNAFPAASDYYKAVQAPARCFTVPKLQAAEFVWDSLGPTLARGSSAVVFEASVESRSQALRCYIREDASSRDRYSALDAYLAGHDLSPYVSGTTWLDQAIMVNRAAWPVLTMEWIDGRTLNEYVDYLVSGSNAAALATLAIRWRELVALLQRSEFAHGDLQHGNVMVDQEGQLRLVDFDGVWIPQLSGQAPPSEFGHPNYQHPLQRAWDRWLDTFSALVIYLSLVALSKEPGLWLALYNSKNLLFAKNDFFPPFTTEAWKQLAALGDPQVDELARRLKECCDRDWMPARSLEAILDRSAAPPARPQVPAEQRWWEQRPAPSPGGFVPPGGSSASVPGGLGGVVPPGGSSASVPGGLGGVVPPGGSRAPDAAGPASASAPRPWAPQPAAAADPAPPGAPPAAPPGGALPAPPPLSAPLSTAGTGPMPHLSQTMMPPGDTIWWTVPPAGSGPAPPGSVLAPGGTTPPSPPGYRGPVPPAPRGYAPYGPVPPASVPPMARPPARAARPQPAPALGAIALGLGIVLLIIGAASHISIIVIGGLVAGAWGIWRLVTGTGPSRKPPGQT
jgi:eukaryotic-like serine/threonine-protein kinase